MTARQPAPPCANDPELFFSDQPEHIERAKQTCKGCWHRLACLNDIAQEAPEFGVWAGIDFTPRDAAEPGKDCSICGVHKPLTDYHRDSRKRDGREARCAACATEQDSKRAKPKRGPGIHAMQREAHLNAQAVRAVELRRSGLTLKQVGEHLGICRKNAGRALQRAHRKGLVDQEIA